MVRAWVGAHQLLVLQGELLVELGVERGRLRLGRLRAHLALLAQQTELLGLLRVRVRGRVRVRVRFRVRVRVRVRVV